MAHHAHLKASILQFCFDEAEQHVTVVDVATGQLLLPVDHIAHIFSVPLNMYFCLCGPDGTDYEVKDGFCWIPPSVCGQDKIVVTVYGEQGCQSA